MDVVSVWNLIPINLNQVCVIKICSGEIWLLIHELSIKSGRQFTMFMCVRVWLYRIMLDKFFGDLINLCVRGLVVLCMHKLSINTHYSI